MSETRPGWPAWRVSSRIYFGLNQVRTGCLCLFAHLFYHDRAKNQPANGQTHQGALEKTVALGRLWKSATQASTLRRVVFPLLVSYYAQVN